MLVTDDVQVLSPTVDGSGGSGAAAAAVGAEAPVPAVPALFSGYSYGSARLARPPERREDVPPGGACRLMLRSDAALSMVSREDIDAALAAPAPAGGGAFPGLRSLPLHRARVRGGVRGGSWRRFPARPPGAPARRKLLQFVDNRRPAWWGRFRARPDRSAGERLSGRAPFAHADSIFNYEVCVFVSRGVCLLVGRMWRVRYTAWCV
jgi:hypothetical protein